MSLRNEEADMEILPDVRMSQELFIFNFYVMASGSNDGVENA
jgi:hypothetical protein